MPQKRSDVWKGQRRAEQPTVLAPTGSPTTEVRHVRCPTCGLMARVEHDENRPQLPSLDKGPYTPYARLQRFGGSVSSPTGNRRDTAGVMIWEAPEPTTGEEIEDLARNLRAGLAILGEEAP